jgi:hypothetical protein
MIRKVAAYSFVTDLSPEAMLERLNNNMELRWSKRTNDNLGDYLISRPRNNYARFRIYTENNPLTLDALLESENDPTEAEWDWALLVDFIHARIFPLLSAQYILRSDGMD